MFTPADRFSSLTQQVAQSLAKAITRGAWAGRLPPERYLARTMQVSRRTIRSAVAILRRQKLVATTPGRASKIVNRTHPGRGAPALTSSVGLLLPESLAHLRSSTMVFIDELRTLLYTSGIRLETYVGHRYYTNRPSAALTELTTHFTHDGWILAYSNRINQRWFQARKIPTVIAGTAHEDVDLPDVDIDMRATCRHAANLLVRKGHHRLALVVEDQRLPGDKRSEAGFNEGAQLLGKGNVATKVCRCPMDLPSIRRFVERLIRGPDAASALLIANAYQYLAIFTVLGRLGARIPQDLSLISRNDEHLFAFLDPEPTRYACSPLARSKAVFAALMHAIQGERLPKQHHWLVPDFVEGATVADLTPGSRPALRGPFL